MVKVNEKTKELKNKFKRIHVKQVLKGPKVISYLDLSREQNVMCPIDKAENNIAFICKKCYVQVLLKQFGLLNTTSNTYQQVNEKRHNVLQQQNDTLDSIFRLKNSDVEFNCLSCIYWLP